MKQETLKNTTDKEDKIIEQLRWELNLVKKQRDDLLKQLKKIKDIIDAKKDLTFIQTEHLFLTKCQMILEKHKAKKLVGIVGFFSNRRGFCGRFQTIGIKDNYICGQWRQRYFKR